ncbi:MAG: type II toxin-antitoxin system RelE/ParE family toxin [Candidatus Coatesbacteria bacterium]|nr:MAG: type II toxin-antitoxin system RelE/ParE family toxin [Candidatus Coatesbacteria bacterium]RLC43530.1 MAG: type II toxin-antitoxin system RelE/ParE family toxin [Candidatus Coatesbacteria bacterium]
MPALEIFWRRSAEKDLRKIPTKTVPRIINKIEKLSDNPLPGGVRKLEGAVRTYRVKVGEYRVVYQIDRETNKIIIIYIRHRKDAYKDL